MTPPRLPVPGWLLHALSLGCILVLSAGFLVLRDSLKALPPGMPPVHPPDSREALDDLRRAVTSLEQRVRSLESPALPSASALPVPSSVQKRVAPQGQEQAQEGSWASLSREAGLDPSQTERLAALLGRLQERANQLFEARLNNRMSPEQAAVEFQQTATGVDGLVSRFLTSEQFQRYQARVAPFRTYVADRLSRPESPFSQVPPAVVPQAGEGFLDLVEP